MWPALPPSESTTKQVSPDCLSDKTGREVLQTKVMWGMNDNWSTKYCGERAAQDPSGSQHAAGKTIEE